MSISSGDPARLWARVGKSPSQLDAYSSDHYTLVKDRLLKILDQLAIKTEADLERFTFRSIGYADRDFLKTLSDILKVNEKRDGIAVTGITMPMLQRALQTGLTKPMEASINRHLPSFTAECQRESLQGLHGFQLFPNMNQTREAALGACKAIEDVIGACIINGQEINATPGIIPKARILQLHQPTVEDTNERRAA